MLFTHSQVEEHSQSQKQHKKEDKGEISSLFFIKLKRQNDTKQRKTLEWIEKIKNIKEKIQFLLKENGNKKRIWISRFENLRKMIADWKLQKMLIRSALQLRENEKKFKK